MESERQEFYVSGGVDDSIHVFARRGLGYYHAAAVTLGHAHGNGLLSDAPAPANTAAPKPITSGIAVNRSGTVAVVANFYNDSISLIDLKIRAKTAELDLRPGILDPAKAVVPGGEYPYWVAVRSDEQAFVSSPRDREIVVVSLSARPAVTARIAVSGQPNRVLLSKAGDRLFAALDNADAVAVIDTNSGKVLETFGVTAPPALLRLAPAQTATCRAARIRTASRFLPTSGLFMLPTVAPTRSQWFLLTGLSAVRSPASSRPAGIPTA